MPITLKEEIEKKFDNKFVCTHHSAQCDGHCKDEYKDFIFQEVIPMVEDKIYEDLIVDIASNSVMSVEEARKMIDFVKNKDK